MENKADKDKHKINQSEKGKNRMKVNYIWKRIDLVELFGLNTTKYLREISSLKMPINDETGQV